MNNGILSESAFDTIVGSLPNSTYKAALYTHIYKIDHERKELIAELDRVHKELAELQAWAASRQAEPSDAEGVKAAERDRVLDIIERHNVGDTVRAAYGRKIAQMIRSGEWT